MAAIAGKTLGYAWRLFAVEMLRLAVCLTLLADRGLSVLDAVTRSAYRMLISHRHMLRWTSFAQASRIKPGLWTRVRAMWPASVLALALAAFAWALGGGRLFWAAPLLAGWAAAPLVAWRASRPTKRVRE